MVTGSDLGESCLAIINYVQQRAPDYHYFHSNLVYSRQNCLPLETYSVCHSVIDQALDSMTVCLYNMVFVDLVMCDKKNNT